MSLAPVWIIATPCGKAVRSKMDVVSETEDAVELGKWSMISLFPSRIPRSCVSMGVYLPTDLPDLRRSRTESSNVCGFVAGIWPFDFCGCLSV